MPPRILICRACDHALELLLAYEVPAVCPHCAKTTGWRTLRAEWPFPLTAEDRQYLRALRIESD